MNPRPIAVKHYQSARQRFLLPSIQRFLQTQCPKLLGPLLAERLAEKIVELVEKQRPAKDHLRPGQLLWNAVSVRTRPDSPKRELVPVILTLVDPADIEHLAQGQPMSAIAKNALARLCREAHQQGALLTMRDIGLFCWRQNASLSAMRLAWEKEHATVLPHSGSLQDFGSCVSHKTTIIHKAVYEKKDPQTVAAETKHSQKAVDRYLKDFHRVRTCYEHKPDLDFICQVTGMSAHLVKQYVKILQERGA
jgi:Protein of unknown function (DUF1670)